MAYTRLGFPSGSNQDVVAAAFLKGIAAKTGVDDAAFAHAADPWTNNPRHVGTWHCRICNRVFAHPSHQYTACAVQAHLVSPAHLKAHHVLDQALIDGFEQGMRAGVTGQ